MIIRKGYVDEAGIRMSGAAEAEPGGEGLDWVSEHWGAVYGLVYRLSGRRHDAEDLAQDTFLRALAKRDSFVAGSNRRAWLMRIATNAFLDMCRRRKTVRMEPLAEEARGVEARPEKQMEGRELGEALGAAIGELTEAARAVFLLRTGEEMSFAEIGEAVGVSEETARWHMMQARKQLVARLDGKL